MAFYGLRFVIIKMNDILLFYCHVARNIYFGVSVIRFQISAKPNKINNDHVARLRVVQEVSSRNSSASWNSSCTFSTEHSLQVGLPYFFYVNDEISRATFVFPNNLHVIQ